jgi:ribosome-associated heat shock protein Hsp15
MSPAPASSSSRSPSAPEAPRLRLDKWLWAARFHKTRGLAADEIERHRVLVNDAPAKPGKEVRLGDRIELRPAGGPRRVVVVAALSSVRGPAPVAQQLYAETPESLAERNTWLERRRLAPEPAASIEQGRPTKRDRRDLADWNRWSVSLDENSSTDQG